MKITYRHYRFPKFPATVWECEEFTGRHGTAYHYQRGVSKWEPYPRGGYTLCIVYNDDGDELAIGVAECSPLDSFCYRVGREIARGRMVKQLFDMQPDGAIGMLAYVTFLGLGWTTATSLGEFAQIHKSLLQRFA